MGSCGWFPLPHDEIVEWVVAHKETLPTTLAELSTYPVAFRRVIVHMVSVQLRTQFWQEHVQTFLEPGSGLADAQRAVVRDAKDQLPEIFGSASLDEMHARMEPLEAALRAVLTREQGAAIFGMVGPPEPPEGLPLPPGTRLTPVE